MIGTLSEKLNAFRDAERERQRIEAEEMKKSLMSKYEQAALFFRENILPNLRQATAQDYSTWLVGYMAQGGEPTHFYDRPIDHDFWVAYSDFEMFPLYGAQSVNIIVQPGVRVDTSRGIGHCGLYVVDGFSKLGGVVPVFSDTEV